MGADGVVKHVSVDELLERWFDVVVVVVVFAFVVVVSVGVAFVVAFVVGLCFVVVFVVVGCCD